MVFGVVQCHSHVLDFWVGPWRYRRVQSIDWQRGDEQVRYTLAGDEHSVALSRIRAVHTANRRLHVAWFVGVEVWLIYLLGTTPRGLEAGLLYVSLFAVFGAWLTLHHMGILRRRVILEVEDQLPVSAPLELARVRAGWQVDLRVAANAAWLQVHPAGAAGWTLGPTLAWHPNLRASSDFFELRRSDGHIVGRPLNSVLRSRWTPQDRRSSALALTGMAGAILVLLLGMVTVRPFVGAQVPPFALFVHDILSFSLFVSALLHASTLAALRGYDVTPLRPDRHRVVPARVELRFHEAVTRWAAMHGRRESEGSLSDEES